MEAGAKPFRAFMVRQTRRQDIATFVRISGNPAPATINDVPLVTLTSAFVISELRTAFQIGFALFLPFIVIDVAVSSVLMSMGMFMLPPAMIALPFKLLLFVLVDGWVKLAHGLVLTYH
jgi:flagellar biosynthesis protein FliP